SLSPYHSRPWTASSAFSKQPRFLNLIRKRFSMSINRSLKAGEKRASTASSFLTLPAPESKRGVTFLSNKAAGVPRRRRSIRSRLRAGNSEHDASLGLGYGVTLHEHPHNCIGRN